MKTLKAKYTMQVRTPSGFARNRLTEAQFCFLSIYLSP